MESVCLRGDSTLGHVVRCLPWEQEVTGSYPGGQSVDLALPSIFSSRALLVWACKQSQGEVSWKAMRVCRNIYGSSHCQSMKNIPNNSCNSIYRGWCQDGNTSSRKITEVKHLELNRFSNGKNLVVSAVVEQCRGTANMVAHSALRLTPESLHTKNKIIQLSIPFKISNLPLQS